ncbi:hypothetical protein AUJ66_02035, partial [Candidatus Desantisbacteria bacterium CG1_02_38_46]
QYNTKRRLSMDKNFFLHPQDPMQRRYEILRAYFVEELNAEEVANRCDCSIHTVYGLLKQYRKKEEVNFFLPLKQGPKGHRPYVENLKEQAISLRKRNYSIYEIEETLSRNVQRIAPKTIDFILKEDGFSKLFRRTNAERLEALQARREYPEESSIQGFATVPQVSTIYGGTFLFIPLILELELDKLLQGISFYGSKQIPSLNYLLSYLGLKLLGKERLCHIEDFNFDYGIGSFAGLNVLPKCAAITQYSYRNPGSLTVQLVKGFLKILHGRNLVKGNYINLDFHSIPHYGDESQLQNNWIPTRGKSMKSILSFFAQDLETTYLCYANADIEREESSDEVLKFVDFYNSTTGKLPHCLVFDSKLTTYRNMDTLNQKGILFITLRNRGKYIHKKIAKIQEWEKVTIDNLKRKYKNLNAFSELVDLKDYQGKIRQIIVTGTGRELPMVLLTNDKESTIKETITTYTHRWLIELNIGENVDFFNLNALSSPIVVKVNFDIAMTLIANTLYKLLVREIRKFQKSRPKTIFRSFIESRAKIDIEKDLITVKFEKRSFNPLIMDWVRKRQNILVPWMGNRRLRFKF